MLPQEAVNTAVQLLAVLIVAGVFYLFAGRNRGGFLQFTGLTGPTASSLKWAFGMALLVVPLTLALFLLTPLHEAATAGNTIAGKLKAQGFGPETAAVIALVALVKTSLTEEIFFRGLIAKRLIRLLGFAAGNALHAAIFAAVHLLIFVVPGGPEFNPAVAGAIFVITGGGGWLMAWLNERRGNGSIAPGWLLHALSNVTAYPLLAFG
jgi:membrane protease YdiL (CAAX protease family)